MYIRALDFVRRSWAAQRSRLRGHVDGLIDGSIRGWVVDLDRPDDRVTIFADGVTSSPRAVLADRYRADLQGVFGSDGYCGFAIPPDACPLDRPIAINATRLRIPLPGSPWTATAPRRGAAKRRGGFLVRATLGPDRLTGSIVALSGSSERRRLLLLAGDQPVRRARACLYAAPQERADPGGDAFCGFSFPLPPGRETLRLVDEASGTVLFSGRR